MKNRVILGMMLIGMILIGTESYMLYHAHSKRLEKNNWQLNSHQCYGNLCINSIDVIANGKDTYVQFQIKNESDNVLNDGIFEIVFNEDLSKKFYCPKLKKNQTAHVKIESDKEEVSQIKEYSVVASTSV